MRELSVPHPSRVPSLPRLHEDAHKGHAGRVLILAGSASMPGAALLCARAASRGGAGLLTLASFDRRPLDSLPALVPEALLLDLRALAKGARETSALVAALRNALEGRRDDACAAGPGLGVNKRTRAAVELLLEHFDGPLLLDADALGVFAGSPQSLRREGAPVLITPHPGEAARLLGREVPADDEGRTRAARELATLTGAVVALKGARTVVTDGENAELNTTGNPALATGGSGDVLTGLAASYLARRSPAWSAYDCLRAAVWVHGRAGDLSAANRGELGTVASDLIGELPDAQRRIEVDPEARP
ncbi:NAD(P)H-hydrate dehydratase [Engelhardtia mirabilis]|uniref:ADP-dependent (S)-NAD(P)H-hydrate dehydratase n=1 Tax=Engelhardtia mirabilis TaxID=2528011 RepID=A0A518BQJ2_9BACT|nr:ATP-dependent (S)-NAD(P)H-hydrate dehydratase [Planctomycetes bacterium Pla133]QDV03570.1 ATP-dependent (S)-NAD(P)H-hydrate dehydratase [Planctomycetes bacterium Pla86]